MGNFNQALYKIIGSRIRNARADLGLNQEELSEKIGISRASVSNIEIGRQQPPLHILYAISQALQTDVQLLLPTRQEIDENMSVDLIGDILKTENIQENTRKKIEDLINKLNS